MTTLPTTEKPIASKAAHPAFFIASWIFFSNITILFNKWLLDTAGFTSHRRQAALTSVFLAALAHLTH
ncbi:duf250 domain membrane protein [Colletotrichum sojae]|uniref:Duf250 domain membrane protein n=1 Tax=Colletotrichum sojae TaxID=2175907 RepID=A0A8H6N3P6_9PEZI|nr:duf250 domain membrane protein [Colletotrichum sojae]